MTRKKEEILNVCVTGSGFKPEVDDIEAGGTNIAFQSAQCSCSSRDPTSQVGLLRGYKGSSEANCIPTQVSSFNKLLLYLHHILIFSKFGFIDQSRERNISVGGTDAKASRPTVLVAWLQLKIN
ncbi:hypothetical protein BDL97_17G043400 [Sphagnum fallax]|jgi:hypothetical protein|nr:hypothetical protein BDL97_17G043400 [Sphagnum fallax]